MREVFLYLWQFPQIFLGFILVSWLKFRKEIIMKSEYKGIKIFYLRDESGIPGVSLGNVILISKFFDCTGLLGITLAHEYGHIRQSQLLGPLYLIIIGLPSLAQNIASTLIGHEYAADYFKRYPESCADKLGGVQTIGGQRTVMSGWQFLAAEKKYREVL